MVRKSPTPASTAVTRKSPESPAQALIQGPITRASAKETPMLAPTEAIALVRFCSRVRSPRSAISVLAMAPAPCSARPAIMP